ncbi:MAG: hypothetical protein CSB55_00770 [Candidatus Cloacimonadota bacterium]|nr:MAG: hypothetical protein CSB55_00770 [Candidatus Cloacimonadota bacterium]
MNALLDLSKYGDSTHYIVIPKIRELTVALGSVVIIYDNGDRYTINTLHAGKIIKEISELINDFYQ